MGPLEQKRSRAMIEKRLATVARNARLTAAASRFRAADPLEQAKAYLRREGFRVYAHSVFLSGSDLIMVGSEAMTEAEVITKAEAVRERRAGR